MDSSETAMKQIRQALSAMKKGQEQASEGLKKASESLDKVSEGFDPLNEGLEKMYTGLDDISEASGTYTNNQDILDDVFFLPENILDEAPELKDAMSNYISDDGKGLIIEVILSVPPYTNEALDTVKDIRSAVEFSIRGTSLENSEFHMGGGSTALSEVRDITARDLKVVMIFVLSGIFIVLIALLKSLVAPVYLIITIIFSYLSTMGITYLVFQKLLGHDGLHWAVPFFSFCVLVALGVDYNIFLMSRVKEEYSPGDNTGSIRRAVSSTGGIITSCGIIMAGTFGAMLASPVLPILEVGFAAVVGLLIDTFIIRCMTVPAIAVKIGEFNWWPGRRIKVIPVEKTGKDKKPAKE
jgi:RND superfamily putative drug exporter